MIYITQGHERSIGPEVFLKAFSLLPENSKEEFIYIGTSECLKKHLELMGIPHHFEGQTLNFLNSKLKCHLIKGGTTAALESSLKLLKKRDILLTLPTSKDQIKFKGKICSGHTDFFRKTFKLKDIAMVFKSPGENILLISDHLPLKEVPKAINESVIVNKITFAIKNFPKYFNSFEEVLISGLNPHAGEGGLLGSEEKLIKKAIYKLKNTFKKINFIGPLSGDSLHFHQNGALNILKVYMYHDQGLVSFKERNGLIGLNVTLGLPFLRMSVDHGTAFELYGKNKANCLGCYYLLIKALEVHHGTRSNKNK